MSKYHIDLRFFFLLKISLFIIIVLVYSTPFAQGANGKYFNDVIYPNALDAVSSIFSLFKAKEVKPRRPSFEANGDPKSRQEVAVPETPHPSTLDLPDVQLDNAEGLDCIQRKDTKKTLEEFPMTKYGELGLFPENGSSLLAKEMELKQHQSLEASKVILVPPPTEEVEQPQSFNADEVHSETLEAQEKVSLKPSKSKESEDSSIEIIIDTDSFKLEDSPIEQQQPSSSFTTPPLPYHHHSPTNMNLTYKMSPIYDYFLKKGELQRYPFIQVGNTRLYVYCNTMNKLNEGEKKHDHYTLGIIRLSNNYIIQPKDHGFLIQMKFYSPQDLSTLSAVCKYFCVKLKRQLDLEKRKLFSMIQRQIHLNLVIDISIRSSIQAHGESIDDYIEYLSKDFEDYYIVLIEKATWNEGLDYDYFRLSLVYHMGLSFPTVIYFFLNEAFMKGALSLEQLTQSKSALKQQLIDVVQRYSGIVHPGLLSDAVEDETFYEKFCQDMELKMIPFYDYPTICGLLFSCIENPKRVILFYDVFNSLRLLILELILESPYGMFLDELDEDSQVIDLKNCILNAYGIENKDYLSNLFDEFMEFLHDHFFQSTQYRKTGPMEVNLRTFDHYMLMLERQIESFLKTQVFASNFIAIIV